MSSCIFSMFSIRNIVRTVHKENVTLHKRYFWHWLNMMFNNPSSDRIKLVGPETACAEWLLRNGAAVRWSGATKFCDDYNLLALTGKKPIIEEIDASDSSISHYGFAHLSKFSCNAIYEWRINDYFCRRM